jgi:hypothetical protein
VAQGVGSEFKSQYHKKKKKKKEITKEAELPVTGERRLYTASILNLTVTSCQTPHVYGPHRLTEICYKALLNSSVLGV